MSTRYAWSKNAEWYHGEFATIEDAFADAIADVADGPVFIGTLYQPHPEGYVDAMLVIDHITCQDEYSHDCADGWPDATESQFAELTDSLQKTIGDWLDRHKLREGFFLVRDAKQYVRDGGIVVELKGGA